MTTWTAEDVAKRFEECVATLKKLPSAQSLGYFNSWPDIVYEPREMARQEPPPIRLMATPRQITRMEETLSWITWALRDTRKIIWLRAHGYPWRAIARETGLSKSTAHRYWLIGLLSIVRRLSSNDR